MGCIQSSAQRTLKANLQLQVDCAWPNPRPSQGRPLSLPTPPGWCQLGWHRDPSTCPRRGHMWAHSVEQNCGNATERGQCQGTARAGARGMSGRPAAARDRGIWSRARPPGGAHCTPPPASADLGRCAPRCTPMPAARGPSEAARFDTARAVCSRCLVGQSGCPASPST